MIPVRCVLRIPNGDGSGDVVLLSAQGRAGRVLHLFVGETGTPLGNKYSTSLDVSTLENSEDTVAILCVQEPSTDLPSKIHIVKHIKMILKFTPQYT